VRLLGNVPQLAKGGAQFFCAAIEAGQARPRLLNNRPQITGDRHDVRLGYLQFAQKVLLNSKNCEECANGDNAFGSAPAIFNTLSHARTWCRCTILVGLNGFR
jgi:hypothetical protein